MGSVGERLCELDSWHEGQESQSHAGLLQGVLCRLGQGGSHEAIVFIIKN